MSFNYYDPVWIADRFVEPAFEAAGTVAASKVIGSILPSLGHNIMKTGFGKDKMKWSPTASSFIEAYAGSMIKNLIQPARSTANMTWQEYAAYWGQQSGMFFLANSGLITLTTGYKNNNIILGFSSALVGQPAGNYSYEYIRSFYVGGESVTYVNSGGYSNTPVAEAVSTSTTTRFAEERNGQFGEGMVILESEILDIADMVMA